jgi:ribosomal protein S18 acetylase RimI-like enzyme
MEYCRCNIKKHNLVDTAKLLYQTEPDLSKLIFGKNETRAINNIVKLIEKESNSFSYNNILLACENSHVYGILIGNRGIDIDKDKEKKDFSDALSFFSALRLHFYNKMLVDRILTKTIKPDDFYVNVINVNNIYRRKGVGSSLLNKAVKIAKEKKCSRIILDVSKDNKNAFKFYKKMDFRIYGDTDFKLFFKKVEVYKMELPLN